MKRLFHLIFIIFLIFSCSTKKNIIYLQNSEKYSVNSTGYVEYKLKVDDILKIDVSLNNELILESVPNLYSNNTNNGVSSNNLDFFGYQIDFSGYINFPSLGKIKVVDKTITEVRSILYDRFQKDGLYNINNISIDIKHINAYFNVLGEVSRPGKHTFLKNNINIIDALGIAGDLLITGKRDDIKLIRSLNGELKVYNIDLTSDYPFENNIQIYSGDTIIVNPNTNRVKNAGIIGNAGNLLSLLSFILSSIIVISNN